MTLDPSFYWTWNVNVFPPPSTVRTIPCINSKTENRYIYIFRFSFYKNISENWIFHQVSIYLLYILYKIIGNLEISFFLFQDGEERGKVNFIYLFAIKWRDPFLYIYIYEIKYHRTDGKFTRWSLKSILSFHKYVSPKSKFENSIKNFYR